VMIPALEGPGGDRVANELRTLVTDMATHTALADREVRRTMQEYDLTQLDEITARQLAQQVRAQLVSWGAVREGGLGLQANIKFIDTASGDQIEITDATGGTPQELAQAIFSSFGESVEGIRQAAFCNDYLASSQYEQALETCDRALAIVPNSSTALYGRATALLNLERFEEAVSTYERLLQLDPAHQDALLGAGFASSRMEQQQQAMGFYNRYLEVNPGNVQVRMTVANDIAQTGDYISAFRVLETGIQEARDEVDFQRYLFSIATAAGQRAREQGEDAVARQIFTAAYNAYQAGFSNGDAEINESVLRNVVAVTSALGRTDDAIRLAQQATERFPNDPQMWSTYAIALRDAERHADQIRALSRVIEINPQYENIYIRRAQAYIANNQRQEALADLRRAADVGDRATVAQVLLAMGSQAVQAQNWTEAETILTPAMEYATGTQRNQAAFFLGFSVFQQGAAIAQANTQGNVAQAERALTFFRRVPPLVQGTGQAQTQQVLEAAQQYIANQEAIIRAARR
jgi:tetratricopeptide (TPR) repeat protein